MAGYAVGYRLPPDLISMFKDLETIERIRDYASWCPDLVWLGKHLEKTRIIPV